MSQESAAMKAYLLNALERSKGDDLERAEMAFRGLSKEQMAQQHGQSDMTRQELLDGYRQYRKKVEAAIKWVESIPTTVAPRK